MRLKDKVALVTGSGSGIGRATALAFASEGARLMINDINTSAVDSVVAEIRKSGGKAFGIVADVSRPDQVNKMFTRTLKELGTLDILINNAGIDKVADEVKQRVETAIQQTISNGKATVSIGATRNMKDEDWDRVLKVHIYGTFYCTREALKIMEDKGSGKIINMASIAGIIGLQGSPDYSAAKGAIIAFTKSVAKEVIGHNIYVNAIAPGFIDTPMVNEAVSPLMKQLLIRQIPVGRFGTPQEVASVALFLASDESSYIAGQVICPAGGGWV